jgi:anaerobic magnesium-protoporphyrin IX monomethyl ester cyclase
MTDCLILGYNDVDFTRYEAMVRAMGVQTGAYRDLALAFVEHEGKLQRALDLFFDVHYEGRRKPERPWNNADYMWLVLTYLGTYLDRRGYTFDYVSLPHFEKEKLREKLVHGNPLTIAITTTLYVAPHPILDLVSFIRQYNRKAKIVIGGPYISGQATALDWKALNDHFKYLGGDIYVINSEGEHALTEIIDCLKSGGDLDKIDNIAYRQGREFVRTRSTSESNPLEENMVEWSLFPSDELGEFVTLRTAKSCPFSCSFCGFPQRAGAYRYLSVELFEKELNAINDLGTVSTLSIIDDTFNVPKPRFKELMRMMIRNKYDFKWNCYYRSDHGDDEAIELMGKAGCEGVLLGVESGSDQILKNMNKSARRKDYLRAIPLLQAAGVSCYASLIIGFPGDTEETVEESLALVEEAKPDYFRTQLWYCDPITPIFQQKEEYGIQGEGFHWRHDTMDVDTACDLIDHSFRSVKNAVWMPQYGFEQWSTFYLKRKGMTMEQVKTAVRCWNDMVKEKLDDPERKSVSPGLIEALRESLQPIDEDAARARKPAARAADPQPPGSGPLLDDYAQEAFHFG